MKKTYASFILATAFMLVISLGVLAATCPSGTTPTHIETVTVPSDGSTVTSTNVLESDITYLLEASGTYRFANWGDYGIADAEWAYRNDAYKDAPLPDHGWTLGENTYPSSGGLGLDVLVDGGNVYWGDYNDAHTYVSSYTGNDNTVSFNIWDSAYGDNSGSLTVDIDKCVDITPPVITFVTPLFGSIHGGVIDLRATCNEDCDYINFWWRAENEVFAWYRYHYVHTDGTVFEWDLDTLNAELAQNQGFYVMEDGTYYLYAAGKDLAGNWARTPEIMVVVLNNKIVHGGGHILEDGVDGEAIKRKDWLDISFGGFIGDVDALGLFGEWQINFHNVNVPLIDKSHFHTTNITSLNLYVGNTGSCTEAMNFGATGEWNGIPGYRIIFRAGDSSDPSSYDTDTVRVELFNPNGFKIYDTYWAGEFTPESDCVGTARTGLDTGNIIIQG